jgi:hypothetical protein
MNISNTLVAAAMGGILLGAAGCAQNKASTEDPATAATAGAKHACKGQNSCKGQGGCKTDAHACKTQNACKGLGGCATT